MEVQHSIHHTQTSQRRGGVTRVWTRESIPDPPIQSQLNRASRRETRSPSCSPPRTLHDQKTQTQDSQNVRDAFQALRYLRKYDGSGDPGEYWDRLTSDLEIVGVDETFAIQNLDRLLEGNALAWFQSRWPSYQSSLKEGHKSRRGILRSIGTDLINFFDQKSRIADYRRKNRELTFKFGDDPETFMVQKLQLFRYINPKMSDETKVDKLIESCPIQIQEQLALVPIDSPNELLMKLRKYCEVRSRAKDPEKTFAAPALMKMDTTGSNHLVSSQTQFPSRYTRPERYPQYDQPQYSHQYRQQYQPPPPRVCYYCNKEGHMRRDCPMRAYDEGRSYDRQLRYPQDRRYDNGRSEQSRGRQPRYDQTEYRQDDRPNQQRRGDHRDVPNNQPPQANNSAPRSEN
jgi:hypothetical protein